MVTMSISAQQTSSVQQAQQQSVRQTQQLSQQQMQSLEILQMPIWDLRAQVDQALQENVFLEVKPPDDAEQEDEYGMSIDADNLDSRRDRTGEEVELDFHREGNNDFERLTDVAGEYPECFDESPRSYPRQTFEASQRNADAIAAIEASPRSMADYLIAQLVDFELSNGLKKMAERIIHNLDADGFLFGGLDKLLGTEASEETRALAEEALAVVQSLDPRGIGARDLRECLLLQLTPDMPNMRLLWELITNHWDDLLHERLASIASRTQFTQDAIRSALDTLRRVSTRPGAVRTERPIVPEIFVTRDGVGQFVVSLDHDMVPELRLNPCYNSMLKNDNTPSKDRRFLRNHQRVARYLIRSLEQRQETLERVSQAIVDHQHEFFEKGPEGLRPLTMQQIADEVGVAVSTVSRTVADKGIETPHGIFLLKEFFPQAVAGDDGTERTRDALTQKLRELIENEEEQRPKSDEQLANELAQDGFRVSRRTVADLRRRIGIPSSRERRRQNE